MRDNLIVHPRPLVAHLARAEHGGPSGDDAAGQSILDFSVCVNPYGPAPSVRDAIARASIDRYPDPTSTAARAALASRVAEPIERTMIGAGAAELIYATCLAFVQPGDRVIVPVHAFGDYVRAATIAGGDISYPDGDPLASPRVAAAAMADAIARIRPRLAMLCVPESPTGRAWSVDEIESVADACKRVGTLLFLDQAYDAFMERPLGTPALRGHDAVLHVRSLTKEHGLPGVRVAFAVGPAPICDAINGVRVPWSVSAHAQAAAIACVSDDAISHASETIALVRQHADELRQFLTEHGWLVEPSDTHYFLVRVGDPAKFRDDLLARRSMRVRNATSFGVPDAIRIAPGLPAANEALLRAFIDVTPPRTTT